MATSATYPLSRHPRVRCTPRYATTFVLYYTSALTTLTYTFTHQYFSDYYLVNTCDLSEAAELRAKDTRDLLPCLSYHLLPLYEFGDWYMMFLQQRSPFNSVDGGL